MGNKSVAIPLGRSLNHMAINAFGHYFVRLPSLDLCFQFGVITGINNVNSFYWFDYETFGTDPAMDWPAQFAGIRTDFDLNEIGEPLNIYCKLPKDHLPHPEACMVTGLDPWEVNEKGLVEPAFIARINQEMMQPGTCSVGYNTLRFDDEVTRNSLYRNFYDPYAREWQNGNSRWDLIDLVRLTAALRPEGINWPLREDGYKSFKLEEITRENGIDHGDAHDALSDVRATIAVAKLIKERQPKVYDFVFRHRGKRDVAGLLNPVQKKPVVHVSGMFGADRQCLSIVVPLADHPLNRNGIIVYDLSVDPAPLLQLTADQIRERLFTPVDELEEGVERVPLKVVHLNKCPVIAPVSVLRKEDCQRLNLDMEVFARHREQLLKGGDVFEKVQQVFSSSPVETASDPDLMLYSGGFFAPDDKERMRRIVSCPPDQLGYLELSFKDRRLDEMLFRYKARHYPEVLDTEERQKWLKFCQDRLTLPGERRFGFSEFATELEASRSQHTQPGKRQLLDKLDEYAAALQSGLCHLS
ncbi:exodeoxyribonuclease I [Endozoicomonas sp. Mp262]|uniref:exodeoxyribonuclease I n=1 Tax=Endozoicomonas sp. Mp262 TaxID=2919499 RepID=UPI0021E07C3A